MNFTEYHLGLFKQRVRVGPAVARHSSAEIVLVFAEVDIDTADVGDQFARSELKLFKVLHFQILLLRPDLQRRNRTALTVCKFKFNADFAPEALAF